MKHEQSVSFSGKAGDVSSIHEVAEGSERAINLPPAEAMLSQNRIDAVAGSNGQASAFAEFISLVKGMKKSKERRRIIMLAVGLGIFLTLSVLGDIRMNSWQGAFYRAVEHKELGNIWKQSQYFVGIVAVLLTFVISVNWLVERSKIRMREWLTHHLLDDWMISGRAYRLNMTSKDSFNPDQRIQEDARSLSDLSVDLGAGIVRSSLTLISFVGVLWILSRGIGFEIAGRSIVIPGYMVWFALLYASIGSWLTAKVGTPLIGLNEQRYTREANFRYSLSRANESAESIAFYGGENDERKTINESLKSVLSTARALSFANARLTWITCGHGWMVVILPLLVALPGYLQGKLDFGALMMVVGAFNNVQQALRWFVENFARIADWRTVLHRVVLFSDAVKTVDEYENQPETIELTHHSEQVLAFEKTSVSLMDGETVIADATAEIHPGERVLIVGESGSGKSTLLRAVGGLWPWGSGRIMLPPKSDMMFLPQRPYMPLGTLAAALAYPNSAQNWQRSDMEMCLQRVNLEAFVELLDESARWDKAMSLGQQQRFAFARLLLHRPKWVFLDEATSALDDENQDLVMSIFTDELDGTALLSIGHRQGLEAYHTRTLQLAQTSSGRVLTRKPRPETKLRPREHIGRKLSHALEQLAAKIQT